MVDQDITLFEDTVANNIRMWDSSIENFAVILAARDAGIHQTIIERPGGYDHMIKEGGKNFSGGQRQRFEIARVLAQEPTIIILDEATSALDAKTEAEVMANIRNIGATCIIIAHRLSTIRDCDQIIVFDQGEAVERGTHEELFGQAEKYTALISSD
jgi:ABC-type bacteriocin/lantibiotic exporter with double-glycine peptidase domain